MRLHTFLTILSVWCTAVANGQITNPGAITNLKLWLSVDSGLYQSGSPNQWSDLSGNGNHAVQATTAQKPTLTAPIASLNNKSALNFDGTNDNLRINGFTLAQPATVICLWNTTANNASQYVLDAAASTNRMILRYLSTSGISMFAGNSLGYPITAPFSFRISGLMFNGNTSSIYENNILKGSGDAGSQTLTGLTIGGRQDLAANFYFRGQMAELIIYDRLLTAQEYMDVLGYLQKKYSPPVSLGNDTTVNYGFCPLQLNPAKPWFNSYSWSTGATASNITVTAPGTYSVTATDIFGIQSVDTIAIARPPFSGLTFNTINSICAGDSVTLNAGLPQTNYTFNWSTGANTPALTVKAAGQYSVTITDTSACTASSNTATVIVDSLAAKASLGPDTVLCNGSQIGLQAGYVTGLNYLWSTGATTETIVPASSGSYWVQVTGQSGCVFRDTINVNISGVAPAANFSFDTVCAGVPTTFTNLSTVSPGSIDSVRWNFATLQQSALNNPTYIFPAAGTYAVSLTAYGTGGCFATITKNVPVNPNPNAGFIADTTCAGLSYSFQNTATSPAGQTITAWAWNFANLGVSSQTNPAFTFSNPGSYSIQQIVTTNLQCKDTALQTLVVIPFNAALPQAFPLYSPAQAAGFSSNIVPFWWGASTNAVKYVLQVSTDANFNTLLVDTTVLGTTLSLNIPYSSTAYYWQVVAVNRCEQPLNSYTRYFNVYTPTLAGNMVLWLAADTALTVTGSAISQWRDISGNNKHAVQNGAASIKPSLTAGQTFLNGKPSIAFNGDYLKIDTFIQSQPLTAFVIWRANTTAGHHIFDGTAPSPARVILRYNTATGSNTPGVSMFAGTELAYSKAAPANYILNTSLYNTSSSSVYENGILKGNGNAGSNTLTGLTIGSRQDLNTSFALNGNIAEMIFFNGSLPTAQRQAVEKYLMDKYAPPVNLGADIYQPYKLCPISLVAGSRFVTRTWSNGFTGDTLNVKKGGTYWVEAVDIFGRISRDTINIVFPYSGMNVGDTLICSYTPLTIQPVLASSTYDFSWNTQAISQAITVSSSNNYIVTITDTTGCVFVSDTVKLQVDSIEFVNLISTTDTILCSGNELQLASLAAYPSPIIGWSNGEDTAQLAFTIPGTYTVEVLDANGCSVKDTVTVDIKTVAAPNMVWSAPPVCFGETTTFSNTSTADPNDNIQSWHWSFGSNGDTSNIKNPTYSYIAPGDYLVTLTAVTDSGCTGVLSKVVTSALPPIPGFTYPEVICAGTPTDLIDQSAFLFGDIITAWVWSVNGVQIAATKNFVYEFPSSGSYEVTLQAISQSGCSDSITETLDVFPTLKADFDYTDVCLGDSTVFTDQTGSLSVVDWQWTLGYSISAVETEQNPKHKYAAPGNYTVTLRVENAIGCVDYETKTVSIVQRPTAKFGNLIACENQSYTPLDSSIVANDTIATWKWTIAGNNYNGQAPTHTFPDSGSYPIKLKVTTQKGCSDSVTRTVSVKPTPTALFTVTPLYGEAPVEVSFINQSSGASTYLWNFGDAGSSADAAPFHTYTANDTFNITLTATSAFGCIDSSSRTFIVAPTDLDIQVDKVNVTKNQQADGSYLVTVQAEVTNMGTRIITDVQYYITIGSGGVISEDWQGLLLSGNQDLITFTAQFVVAAENANSYVCVEAVSVNNGETETRTDNNSQCASTDQTIQVIGPSPNPMSSDASVGIILPKAGVVTIDIMDMAGQYIVKGEQINAPKGRSEWKLPADKMRSAEYFLRVFYNDDKVIRKFVVAKQ